jgi:uncharacterized protein
MRVSALWRYPVKSMRGEPLNHAKITTAGIFGDRLVQVYDARGSLITARSHPQLLSHSGALGPDDEPVIDGHRWTSQEARAIAVREVGHGAHFDRVEERRFDILPLLVATDGAIAAFGRDARRLRPNLIIGGVEGLAERDWQGRQLVIGNVVIALDDLRGRCVMTTVDPETGRRDPNVLRDIVRRFDGRLCLNASVLVAGPIAVGDAVHLD